jgi:hypothetical protein
VQDIILYFYDFQVDPAGIALGLGIPLTKHGVTTNIGEGSFPAFVNGRPFGHWRIANELQGVSSSIDKEDRIRNYLSGRVLVAVSNFGNAELAPCFLSSDPFQTAKIVSLSIRANELGLKHMAGIQCAYLAGHLSELHFPGCIVNTLKEEFSDLENQSLIVGDLLPIILEPAGLQGVFVINEIVEQLLTGNFHFYGNVHPMVGDNASIRFSGDVIGSRLMVASQLGEVIEVVSP